MVIRKLIWDEWNIEHISRHNVEPDEVEEVCEGSNLLNKSKNKTYRVIGQTDTGRYLTIFIARKANGYYPVTARDSTKQERKAYGKIQRN